MPVFCCDAHRFSCRPKWALWGWLFWAKLRLNWKFRGCVFECICFAWRCFAPFRSILLVLARTRSSPKSGPCLPNRSKILSISICRALGCGWICWDAISQLFLQGLVSLSGLTMRLWFAWRSWVWDNWCEYCFFWEMTCPRFGQQQEGWSYCPA